MLGVTTAMIYLSWGAIMVQNFGTENLVVSMVIATVIMGGLSTFFAFRASKTGLGAELLSRRSLGFLGSVPSAVIYGLSLIMFFAFEGGIVVNSITASNDNVPRSLCIVVAAIICIPLVLYGMKIMNIVMWVTLPIYGVFMVITIWHAMDTPPVDFWNYRPDSIDDSAGPPVLQIVAAAIGYTVNISLCADSGRFIKPQVAKRGSLIVGGFAQLITFMGITLLGAWLGLRFSEADPGIYLPAVMGLWGVLFVVVTQLRINVVNLYGASIALANAFSRILPWRMGRVTWTIISIALGAIAIYFDLYGRVQAVMTFAGVFLLAWIMTVFSEHVWTVWVFRFQSHMFAPISRSEARAFNPVGISSLAVSLLLGAPLAFGAAGAYGMTIAPFVAGILPLVIVPVAALFLRDRVYGPRVNR
ncbi:hypothetical protein BJF89_16345 [Corynebacterium sp. CNJ-954]|nr:hypothetical protein BJF89_16345 [Corynebacterium sp. CNJ-954]